MSENSLNLPGISPEYLSKAGVRHIDAGTAETLCGINESGTLFPYYDLYGEPIEDGPTGFARLRLD